MHPPKKRGVSASKNKKGHGLFYFRYNESNDLSQSVIGGETRKI